MIKSIWVDNFKSLVGFKLKLAKLTCLVGLNGSGKSTVLQAMDFLSQLMLGDVEKWLNQRHWKKSDINSKLTRKKNVDFTVVIHHQTLGEIVWVGSVNLTSLHCTAEWVKIGDTDFLKVLDNQCMIKSAEKLTNNQTSATVSEKFLINFKYQGSILSQLKDNQLNEQLKAIKNEILQIRSLDLLSPELLRSQTKIANGKLGLGGEKLSAFIHETGTEGKKKLLEQLAQVYAPLKQVDTRALRSGWKQIEIIELFGEKELISTARHINDGMLRLMAIFAQLECDNHFLLFDEIENGVNPELVEYLIDHLVNASHQILITTHSPMILNFLDDDIATQGVVYLYKNSQGYSCAIKLFEIPSMAKKLAFMGPGEAFIDTDLTHLYEEIEATRSNTGAK